MITLRTIEDIVKRHVRPLLARSQNATLRGVLQTIDDSTGLARGQTTTVADQLADDIEFVTPYGLSFVPAGGAETVAWSINGSARHLLGMIFDRRIRLKGTLAAGEVALHIGVADQLVHLKANGDVVVRAGTDGGTITVKADGNIVVEPGAGGGVYLGDAGATKKVALADELNELRNAFNSHTHPTAPVGPVSVPTVIPGVIPVPSFPGSTNVYGKG